MVFDGCTFSFSEIVDVLLGFGSQTDSGLFCYNLNTESEGPPFPTIVVACFVYT